MEPTKTTTAFVSSTTASVPKVTTEKTVDLLDRIATLEAKLANAEPNPTVKASLKTEEIDWSKVSEKEVADLSYYIPVIEHELPAYMTLYCSDNNYVVKWANVMPQRVGMLLASGYTYLLESEWDLNFPKILPWGNDGHLTYGDVVAVKCHKSRYYGRIRREHEKATQVRGVAGYNKVLGQLNKAINNIPQFDSAISRGAISFYGEQANSNVEVHI